MSCIFMAMKASEKDLFRLLKRTTDSRIMGSSSAWDDAEPAGRDPPGHEVEVAIEIKIPVFPLGSLRFQTCQVIQLIAADSFARDDLVCDGHLVEKCVREENKIIRPLWREGMKVPQRQPKRGRLWLSDGSRVRLRPTHRNRVWSYDFVAERTHDGRSLRLLTVIDEYSRECLAIVVER
jgi:hypothetical protein